MRIFFLFPLILLLALSACAAPQKGSGELRYQQPGTPGGRLCTSQCTAAYTHCQDACRYRERICTYDVQSQAIRDYEAYMTDRFKDKQAIDLRPRDFERMDLCAPKTCLQACISVYNDCFIKCGGLISFQEE